jgi:two-component system phosphate regulon sensor histidine kinase PhoR
MESLEAGVVVADAAGRVQYANPAAWSLLGVEPEALLGRRFLERYDGYAVSRVLELLSGEGEARERLHLTDSDRWLALRILQADDATRVAVLNDVSDFVRTERLRREFVANASHELRTPVMAMSAALEALEMGAKEEPALRDRFLQRAAREAERLRDLTQNLLDLSLAEEEATPAAQGVDVARLTADVMESFEAVAANRRQTLRFEDATESPPKARVPEVDLTRVLLNLIDNALKYTPEGGLVRVTLLADAGEVEIVVTDSGPGIPPAQLDRVFERFFRIDRSRSRSPGAGLGLSIARHLVERNGGSIKASNVTGGGARFTVRLPAA